MFLIYSLDSNLFNQCPCTFDETIGGRFAQGQGQQQVLLSLALQGAHGECGRSLAILIHQAAGARDG
jgi:hypothetical protein